MRHPRLGLAWRALQESRGQPLRGVERCPRGTLAGCRRGAAAAISDVDAVVPVVVRTSGSRCHAQGQRRPERAAPWDRPWRQEPRWPATPYSQGRALSLAGSNESRRSNATRNTSPARSSADSDPTRRERYRWIVTKWRSKTTANQRGSARARAITSASLPGSVSAASTPPCCPLRGLRFATCGVLVAEGCGPLRVPLGGTNFRDCKSRAAGLVASESAICGARRSPLPVQPNARHLGRPAARLLPDLDASCRPPIAQQSRCAPCPPTPGRPPAACIPWRYSALRPPGDGYAVLREQNCLGALLGQRP